MRQKRDIRLFEEEVLFLETEHPEFTITKKIIIALCPTIITETIYNHDNGMEYRYITKNKFSSQSGRAILNGIFIQKVRGKKHSYGSRTRYINRFKNKVQEVIDKAMYNIIGKVDES